MLYRQQRPANGVGESACWPPAIRHGGSVVCPRGGRQTPRESHRRWAVIVCDASVVVYQNQKLCLCAPHTRVCYACTRDEPGTLCLREHSERKAKYTVCRVKYTVCRVLGWCWCGLGFSLTLSHSLSERVRERERESLSGSE
jgi:hypothetical protein